MRKFPPTDLQRARSYTVTVVMLAHIPDGRPVQNQTKKKLFSAERQQNEPDKNEETCSWFF